MNVNAISLGGCFELEPATHRDERGTFRKVLQRSAFLEHGLTSDFAETFFTHSHANVLRGIHVQLPPAEHTKLVHCIEGAVMDVLVDLRAHSPTFGNAEVVRLTARRGNAVYIAPGVAHGFYVVEGPAVMLYQVSSEHDPRYDTGVLWSSLSVPWPTRSPLVSARDARLPSLAQFVSNARREAIEARAADR